MLQNSAPFEFGINRIQDCGFAIEESIEPIMSEMQVGYAMNHVLDLQRNLIHIIIKAQFTLSGSLRSMAQNTVLTTFFVKDLTSFTNSDGKIDYPKNMAATLFGLSFTHLRAIMAKNMGGSRFQDFYLPVLLDPVKLFYQMAEDMEKDGINPQIVLQNSVSAEVEKVKPSRKKRNK